MAKLQQIARVIRCLSEPLGPNEAQRFFVCPVCDQAVDMGSLDELVYHNQRTHLPLEFDA
jgi:hypothetical protein